MAGACRGPGRHGALRRPGAAAPPDRRAGRVVRGTGHGLAPRAHRGGPAAGQGRQRTRQGPAERQGRGVPAVTPHRGAVRRLRRAARRPLRAQERPPRRPLPGEVPGPPVPRGGRRDLRRLRRPRARRAMGARPSTSWSARRPAASSWPSRRRASWALRGIFAEEVKDADGTARREFRRGFHLEPGERVLLVDDILTTGGSLLAMLPPIEASGARARPRRRSSSTAPGARAAWPRRPAAASTPSTRCGRSTSRPTSPVPATCPACAAGVPLEAPGSSGIEAPDRASRSAPSAARRA